MIRKSHSYYWDGFVSNIHFVKRGLVLFNKTIKKNANQIELSGYIKSLISLMKPRVMSLVIFTCAVGFLTSSPNLKTFDAIIAIILVALGSGAAGCLNMWYEACLLYTSPSPRD